MRASFIITVTFITVLLSQHMKAQSPGDFEALKAKADSAFEASDYTLALERYSDLVSSYSKAGLPKNQTYYLSLFRNLNCLIITKDFDAATALQERIYPDVFQGDAKAYQANFYFLKAKLLLRSKRAYQASYDEYQKAYKIKIKESAPSTLRAETAHELAVILTRYLNKNDSAIHYYNKAKSDYIQLHGEISNEVANEIGFMAQTYYFMRQPDKNLEFLRKSVVAFVQVIDPEVLSKIPMSMGYDSMDVFYAGLAQELKRPEVLEKLPKNSLANIANLGNGLMEQQSNLTLSEDYLLVSMELNIKFDNTTGIAGTSQGLAGLYYRRNQFQFAIDYYDQAEKFYVKAGIEDPAIKNQLAWVYMNKGSLYNTISKIDSSIKYTTKGLEMRRTLTKEPSWLFSYSYLSMGLNAHASKDFEGALKYYKKAEYNQYYLPAQLDFSRGEVFNQMDQVDSAFYYYRKSVATFPNKKDINYLVYLNTLGNYFVKNDQLDSGFHYYDKSILTNQKNFEDTTKLKNLSQIEFQKSMHPVILLQSIKSRALAYQRKYEKTGDTEELKLALDHYDLSTKLIAFVRTSFIQEIDNIQFYKITREVIEGALGAYQTMFDVKKDHTYLEKAFEMADIGRSQIIMDAIKTRQIYESNVNENLLEVGELKKKISAQQETLEGLKLNNEDKEEILRVEEVLLQIENRLLTKLSEIKESQPNLYQYLSEQGTNLAFEELKKYAAGQNGTIVEFFWGQETLYTLALSKEGIKLTSLEIDLKELSERLDRFKQFIVQPGGSNQESLDRFTEDGFFIYDNLLGHILEGTVPESLIIIPDGPLSNLPFEALPTEEVSVPNASFKNVPYLIKERQVEYLTSAAILLENLKNESDHHLQDFAAWAPFSNPDDIPVASKNILRSENLGDLPGTAEELRVLEAVFDGTRYFGEQANEESFKVNANSAKLIHIATHGIINDQETLRSNLLFSKGDTDDTNEDNRLYMFELYSLQLNTELAVLTACNTGAGKQEQGEGTISLARAFKYAGAKSVLMSLWLANDQSTSDIVGNFYRNLADKQTKGEALRNAKLQYLNQADNLGAHPFYWSHLILSGDSSPLSSSPFSQTWLLAILLLVVIIAMAVRSKRKTRATDFKNR